LCAEEQQVADNEEDAEIARRIDETSGRTAKARIRDEFIRSIGRREIEYLAPGEKVDPTLVDRVQRRLKRLAELRPTDFKRTNGSIKQVLKGLRQGQRKSPLK
jgi:hypothetical protein